MQTWKALLIAAPIATGLLAAPAAHADWRGHGGDRGGWHGDRGWHGGGWHGDRGWHGGGWHRDNGGGAIAGAVIGLGVGALLGGVLAAQQPAYVAPPPVTYAPPPVYYSAPSYPVAPGYYSAY